MSKVKSFVIRNFENVQVANRHLESILMSYMLAISHLMQIDVTKVCAY